MKVYYDSSTPADGVENTELLWITSYPECTSILDQVGSCVITVRDFEGSEYATWKDLNFRKVRIEDDSSNIIWRGYIVKKTFTSKDMTLFCRGIGALLEWRTFTHNYVFAEGIVETVPAGTDLVLKDNNEGDPFEWAVDQWHEGDQDKGLMITDNTNTMLSKTWDSSAIAVTGAENQVGNNASTLTPNNDVLKLRDDDALPDTYVDLTIDGDAIADTNSLKSIEISYQFGMRIDLNQLFHFIVGFVRLQIKKDATWTHVKNFLKIENGQLGNIDISPSVDNLLDPVIIEGTDTELQKYFNKTGAFYTSLKGIRFTSVLSSNSHPLAAYFYLNVDYLSVKINYHTADISPIMRKITDNGASWIACDGTADWSLTGVNEEDSFVIGGSTTQILNDLGAEMGISIYIQSTLTKYIARWIKGVSGLSVLKMICDLEGCHWWEDYINDRIVISKEADFVDSTSTVAHTDYEWDWVYEDEGNNYYRVDVFGSASLNIHAFKEDLTIDSPKSFTIIEEQILTVADAQEVANEKFAEMQTKEPSIMTSVDGVNAQITVGTTVNVTMSRPTVAAADYPIRRITRTRKGITGIKTILYCGLGSSPIEETVGVLIRDNAYRSQKAHTDRLISSPLSGSAVITWTDVGGRTAGVESVITAELVNGQSIDNRIDALIAAYATAQHNRLLSPTSLRPRQGETVGANNVYWGLVFIEFGNNSHASNNKVTINFKLPEDYVNGTDLVFHFNFSGTANDGLTGAYQMYTVNTAAISRVNVDPYNITLNANGQYPEQLTVSGTNVVAEDLIMLILEMEDIGHVNICNLRSAALEITVNTSD